MNKKNWLIFGGVFLVVAISIITASVFIPSVRTSIFGLESQQLEERIESVTISEIEIEDDSSFTWISGEDVFRFTGSGYSFDIELTVNYLGTERSLQDIRGFFPEVVISDYVSIGSSPYKFSVDFENIPGEMAQNIDNFNYRLVAWENLTLDDVERLDDYTISIRENGTIISFKDLIDNNYTLTRPDFFTVGVYGNAEHFVNGSISLDPVVIVNTTNQGGGRVGFSHFLVNDPINKRVHRVYSDSDFDIHAHSAPWNDTTNWTDGGDIVVGSFGQDDFDCRGVSNSTNAFMYCVYTTGASDTVLMKRVELIGIGDFTTVGTEQTIFDSGTFPGGGVTDDASLPRMIITNDSCVYVTFLLEDDSAADTIEFTTALITENSTAGCGDGIWATNTYDFINLTIWSSEAVGGQFESIVGIEGFGDLDAQLIWTETNAGATGDINLASVYFNGSIDTLGTIFIINSDIEDNSAYSAAWIDIADDTVVTYAMDDLTTDLDSYSIVGRGTTSVDTKSDTGLNINFVNNEGGTIAGVYNSNSSSFWVFGVDNTDPDDIYYTNSTDDGSNWGTPVLWVDDGSLDGEIKDMSALYNSELCQIYVTWLANEVSPFSVSFENITVNCPSAEDNTPPTFSLNQTNTTVANTPVLFSILYDDETALQPDGQYIFSTNNSGGSWTNESAVNFTATPNWANVTKLLNSTVGTIVGYRWFTDDNAGNVNNTGIFTVVTTSSAPEFPQWSDNSTNSTIAGQAVEHRVRWTDNSALSGYIFSYCNGTYSAGGGGGFGINWSSSHIAGTFTNPNNALGATDGTWTTDANGDDPDSRFAMENTTGAISGTQNIIVLVRPEDAGAGGDPTIIVELFENGVSVRNIVNSTMVLNTDGDTNISGTFDASEITDPDDVEIRLIVTSAGGGPNANTLQVDSIRWNVTLAGGGVNSCLDGSPTFTNASFVGMVGTNNWSNITMVTNSTVGSTIKWRVYANDSANNWNQTSIFAYNTTAAVGDTCTYGGSGDWVIDCTDFCNISSPVVGDGSDIVLSGIGLIKITAEVSGFNNGDGKDKCIVDCNGGCFT